MYFLRPILRFCLAMLIAMVGTGMAFAVTTTATELTYHQTENLPLLQTDDIDFAARAPPLAVFNIEVTGGVTVIQGSAFALHGQETVAALFGFGRDFIATNRTLPDFQHGQVNGKFDAITPGPLDDGLAETFVGGRYSEVVLDKDVVFHRAGTGDVPLGQFFTQTPPDGVIKTRIDSAVLPEWPGGGKSPIDSSFEVKIPAGTKVYVGEVSSQGGFYVGGTQQIVVPKPWLLDGVEVLGSKPLK